MLQKLARDKHYTLFVLNVCNKNLWNSNTFRLLTFPIFLNNSLKLFFLQNYKKFAIELYTLDTYAEKWLS